MIAVDSNLLVHAHRQASPDHRRASRLIHEVAESPERWAIPWPCLHEFFSVVTNRRIVTRASTHQEAIDQIDAWLSSPSVVLLGEAVQHWTVLRQLLDEGGVAGPLVHDAKIAAICLAHGVSELWTADRDFSRFPRLRTRNPLVA